MLNSVKQRSSLRVRKRLKASFCYYLYRCSSLPATHCVTFTCCILLVDAAKILCDDLSVNKFMDFVQRTLTLFTVCVYFSECERMLVCLRGKDFHAFAMNYGNMN